MKKKTVVIFVLLIGILMAQSTGAGNQVFDWAWSEIGWISFRNDNTNAHFSLVNDDSDATWVDTASGVFQYDAYKLADPVGAAGAITEVEVRARYRGEVDLALRLNGVEEGVGVNISSNNGGFKWTVGGGESIARPGGGVWTWQDIEDLQVVVGSRQIPGVVDGYISIVEVIVNGVTYLPNATGSYTNIANPVPASPIGYGVEIDITTGALSGYAWSDNIGWISFEPVSVVGCPDTSFIPDPIPGSPCQAYINLTDGKVYGWARACSVFDSGCSGAVTSGNLGGWSGWIKFDGSDPLYESYLDSVPNPSEFRKWAWGDNVVIGWVSLNNIDTGGPVDYEVKTDLKSNTPPVASFTCEDSVGAILNPCQTYLGTPLYLINRSTDSDGSIVLSTWYQDGVSLYSCFLPGDPLCDNTYGGSRGQWSVKLYVEDDLGGFNETAPIIVTVLRDIVASFQCSLDQEEPRTWQPCSAITPIEGDTLYLKDTSVPSERDFGVNAAINSWEWRIVGGGIIGNIPEVEFEGVLPSMVIRLTVTDDNGRTASKDEPLSSIMPLPIWREIPPF